MSENKGKVRTEIEYRRVEPGFGVITMTSVFNLLKTTISVRKGIIIKGNTEVPLKLIRTESKINLFRCANSLNM